MDMSKGGRSLFWAVGSMENSITCHQLSLPFRKNFPRHIIHERLLWSGKGGGGGVTIELFQRGGGLVYTYLEWLWSLVKEA
jgi:hypothetical protein